ncbi:hypothetical protein [Thermophilibacter mediterraneus]|uniref:hypothetical protein n=1 Tax=Thermophilibacter mediterraneus TaxID=1871031 RepID=UPI00320AF272
MRESRICLAARDSLKMLRLARRTAGLALVPADERALRGADDSVSRDELLETLPREVFQPELHPVHLRFDDAGSRSRCSLVQAHSGLGVLPADCYLEVLRSSGDPLGEGGGGCAHVFVESGGMMMASAASALAAAVAGDRLSEDEAQIKLVSLAMELCGIYARDPLRPLSGDVAHDLAPIGTVSEAIELLGSLGRRRGVALARRALQLANDGSGSAMETFWYGIFCLPPRLGGAHLPRPLQNVALEWPADVVDVVSHERMRPDFHWPRYRTACEHQGGDHTSERALAEDSRRARDYELCHMHYLPLTKEDARNEGAVRALLAQLFEVIGPYEGESFPRRARRVLNDPKVRGSRRVLMGHLLPPVTCP